MGQQVRINEYEPDRNRRFYRGSVESCGTATAKTNPIFKAYVVNLKSSTLPLLLETVEQQPAFITVLPLWDDTVVILIVISPPSSLIRRHNNALAPAEQPTTAQGRCPGLTATDFGVRISFGLRRLRPSAFPSRALSGPFQNPGRCPPQRFQKAGVSESS